MVKAGDTEADLKSVVDNQFYQMATYLILRLLLRMRSLWISKNGLSGRKLIDILIASHRSDGNDYAALGAIGVSLTCNVCLNMYIPQQVGKAC